MTNRVLTCGTFDLFHIGHVNMLKKAKKEGNYLIVGISSDKCNKEKGKKSIINQKERMAIVESCKYVDKVFIEETLADKQLYVDKYDADLFVIGDDWKGKFDNLSCKVKYLPRTKDISTTQIKTENFPDIWFLKLFDNCNKMVNRFYEIILDKILFEPLYASLFGYSLIIPIIITTNNSLKSVCFITYDLCLAVNKKMALIYDKKEKSRQFTLGIIINETTDKVFLSIVNYYLLNNPLLTLLIFFKFGISSMKIYNNIMNKNKLACTSSYSLSIFLQNISLSIYYLDIQFYNYLLLLSLILGIQSFYEQFKIKV
jgi:glycerol-3-phosphate cytidylyltransferase